MTSSPIKASKLTIIKMDVAMTDIHRIWKSVDSEYVYGKRKLSDARSLLYKDTIKAYKLIRKARDDIIEESKAAQEYNRYRDIVSQIDDKEVHELDEKYLDSLRNGNFKKARETAVRISQCKIIKDSGHSIEVKLESSSKGHLIFDVTNTSNSDLIVKRFAVFVSGQQLSSDTVYPFTIHHNAKIKISFTCDVTDESEASVLFEYSESGIVKTLSFSTLFKMEV